MSSGTIGAGGRVIGFVEPSCRVQPCIEGSFGDCGQHPDHGRRDPCLMQKAAVCGKDLSAVIIEAENHPGPHLHPGVLDTTDLLSDAAATTEVLKLLRFAQRVLIGAFDANE